jgi:hypothetical protein
VHFESEIVMQVTGGVLLDRKTPPTPLNALARAMARLKLEPTTRLVSLLNPCRRLCAA